MTRINRSIRYKLCQRVKSCVCFIKKQQADIKKHIYSLSTEYFRIVVRPTESVLLGVAEMVNERYDLFSVFVLRLACRLPPIPLANWGWTTLFTIIHRRTNTYAKKQNIRYSLSILLSLKGLSCCYFTQQWHCTLYTQSMLRGVGRNCKSTQWYGIVFVFNHLKKTLKCNMSVYIAFIKFCNPGFFSLWGVWIYWPPNSRDLVNLVTTV